MGKKARKRTYVKKSLKSKVKKSRHIPVNVSNQVKSEHFFQCAWCGNALTDRHHIQEFSEEGEHTSENLILLCPNDHRDIHQNKSISKEELIKRKSTHKKDDRVEGGFRSDLKLPNVMLGENFFQDTYSILNYNNEDIISLSKTGESILVNLRFYSKDGNLKLWMSRNRYWVESKFLVTSKKDFLEIKDENESNFFKMWQVNNVLYIEGKCYLNGMLYEFDGNGFKDGGVQIYHNVLDRGIRKGYDDKTGDFYTLIG